MTKFKLDMDEFNEILNLSIITKRFRFDDRPSWICFNPRQFKSLLNFDSEDNKILINANEFELFGEKIDVDNNKDWMITFNDSIDIDNFDDTKIFVLDENDHKVDVEIAFDSEDDKIIVKSLELYMYDKQYRLYIQNGIKSKSSKELKKGVLFKFRIKK